MGKCKCHICVRWNKLERIAKKYNFTKRDRSFFFNDMFACEEAVYTERDMLRFNVREAANKLLEYAR